MCEGRFAFGSTLIGGAVGPGSITARFSMSYTTPVVNTEYSRFVIMNGCPFSA
jgi:hypothetical protein